MIKSAGLGRGPAVRLGLGAQSSSGCFGARDSTGQLFILFLFFQSSFFLGTKLGLFLLLSFAFIFFSTIAHICLSLLENNLFFLTCPRKTKYAKITKTAYTSKLTSTSYTSYKNLSTKLQTFILILHFTLQTLNFLAIAKGKVLPCSRHFDHSDAKHRAVEKSIKTTIDKGNSAVSHFAI